MQMFCATSLIAVKGPEFIICFIHQTLLWAEITPDFIHRLLEIAGNEPMCRAEFQSF